MRPYRINFNKGTWPLHYNPEKHHRRSVRLKNCDYAQAGAYFVTICSRQRECIFGDVIDGAMHLNEYGELIHECLYQIPRHFPNIEMDMHVIMPNHFHGIFMINSNCRGEVSSPSRNSNKRIKKGGVTPPLRKRTLGQIVAYFKYQTSKQINKIRNSPGMPVWQRNYFERVIRNENELNKIRQYIQNNPLQWDNDKENPKNIVEQL